MFNINFLNKSGLQKEQSKNIDNEIVDVQKDEISESVTKEESIKIKEKKVFPKKYIFLIVVAVFLSLIAYDLNSTQSRLLNLFNSNKTTNYAEKNSIEDIVEFIAKYDEHIVIEKLNINLETSYLYLKLSNISSKNHFYELLENFSSIFDQNVKAYTFNDNYLIEFNVFWDVQHDENFVKLNKADLKEKIKNKFKNIDDNIEDYVLAEINENKIIYKFNNLNDIYNIIKYLDTLGLDEQYNLMVEFNWDQMNTNDFKKYHFIIE